MASDDKLSRVLRVPDLAALAIGSVIGSGIFAVPGMVAENIGSPMWF